MAFPAWPATVPEYAMLAGNTEEFANNKSSFQPEVGPSLDRRRTSINNSTLRFNSVFTAAEFTTLETFWIDELKDGTLVFTRTHPRKLTSSYFKFAGPLKIAEFITPDTFLVPFDLVYLGDAPALSAESQQFLDRVAAQDSAHENAYRALIDALVAGGVWTKLDALYLLAAADDATALTSLISATYDATAVNSPTFTADEGFTAGASTHIDTNLLPDGVGSNLSQDSNSIFVWNLTAAFSDQHMVNDSALRFDITLRYSAANDAYFSNSNSAYDTFTVTDASGFWVSTRNGAPGYTVYRNGASYASITRASIALTNLATIKINFQFSGTGGVTPQITAAAGVGSGLSAGEVTTLTDAIETYLTAVGAI